MTEADPNIDLAYILSLIGAGAPLRSPEPVVGGLLHRMWRVEAQNGTFAVKVLNPEIMSRGDALQNFRVAERVARAAYEGGIRAVVARTAGEDPWLQSNGFYVMVFDWIDGRTLLPEECTSEHAGKIGGLLCRMHSLNIAIDGLEPSVWSSVPPDTWERHIGKARQSLSCWEFPCEGLLRDVINWSGGFRTAAGRLSEQMVVSHRDLDAKNVLWNGAYTPHLIDWESAGYVNPGVELMEVALNWSRSQDGTSDKTCFQAVVQRYMQAGGSLRGDVLDALRGATGGMLGWLEYNMRRSLDEDVFGRDERALAQRQVKQTVRELEALDKAVPGYVQWFEEVSRHI